MLKKSSAVMKGLMNPAAILSLLAPYYGERNMNIYEGNLIIRRRAIPSSLHPLKIEPELQMDSEDPQSLVDAMFQSVSSDSLAIEESVLATALPSDIRIGGDLGIHSSLRKSIMEAVFNPGDRPRVMAEEIIPTLKRMGLKVVTPVRMNIDKYQRIAGLTKILVLANSAGYENVQVQFNRNILDGIAMPGGLALLGLPECFLHSSGIAITCPITIGEHSFHFYSDKPVLWNFVYSLPFTDIFHTKLRPMVTGLASLPYPQSSQSIEVDAWKMLRHSVKCTNSLISFANDVFNFTDEDAEVDSLSQFQFTATLHLLFADMLTMKSSLDDHMKMKMAFSALSKVANLIKLQLKSSVPEENYKDAIIQEAFLEKAREIICECEDEVVSSVLLHITDTIYGGLHTKLKSSFPDKDERVRSVYLRTMRNCYEHGAFLKKNMFEQVFLKFDGRIPSEVVHLPFILINLMSISPEKFFDFFRSDPEKNWR